MLAAFLFAGIATAAAIQNEPSPAQNASIQKAFADANNLNAHTLTLPPRPPFVNRKNIINERKIFRALNATLEKYNASFTLPPFKELRLSARQENVPLEDDQDLDYDGPVNIGYPQYQTFAMDFDTGSSDIIVPGPGCGVQQGCAHTLRYRQKGSALQTDVTYTYGGGKATGNEYSDTVTVGGLTVHNQGLLSVTEAQFLSKGGNDYDGLFGMAFTGASGSNATTFMENIISNKQIPAPEFSFYLGRAFNGTTGSASQLTIGGRDNSKYTGYITPIPVVQQTAWIVEMPSITINGISAGASVRGLAALDTGTSFIVVPISALALIFAGIPGAVPIPVGSTGSNNLIMYAYPCLTPAAYIPTFHLGNQTTGQAGHFAIDPEDFSLGLVDSTFASALAGSQGKSESEIEAEGLCLSSLLGVQDNVNPELYVLGTPFLKSWYSVFNYGDGADKGPTVGFAKSLNCWSVGC